MSDAVTLIRDDILIYISDIFEIKIYDYLQIDQGYLNLKWKIETDVGSLFVKQYNKTRYPENFVNQRVSCSKLCLTFVSNFTNASKQNAIRAIQTWVVTACSLMP